MNTPVEKAKTAVAKKQPVKSVWEFFESRKTDIAKVLPRHVTADRLIGVMSFMIKSNADIANASLPSLIAAVIQTCQMGLEPGTLGHVYYVPFNNRKKDGTTVKEVQFILGYKGIVELLNKAGKAVLLSTECVYANDHFKHELGLNPVLEHVPTTGDRGAFVGVYSIAKNLVANEKVFIFLTKEEVDKVRASSKAGKSQYSPWTTWYEEMAKKTAVRRLCKLLPLSIEEQHKVATDESTKTVIDVDMTRVPDETVYEQPTINHPVATPEEVKLADKGVTTATEVKDLQEKTGRRGDPTVSPLMSEAQRKRMFAVMDEKKISEEIFKAYLKENYGIESRKDITKEMYVDISLWLEGK